MHVAPRISQTGLNASVYTGLNVYRYHRIVGPMVGNRRKTLLPVVEKR